MNTKSQLKNYLFLIFTVMFLLVITSSIAQTKKELSAEEKLIQDTKIDKIIYSKDNTQDAFIKEDKYIKFPKDSIIIDKYENDEIKFSIDFTKGKKNKGGNWELVAKVNGIEQLGSYTYKLGNKKVYFQPEYTLINNVSGIEEWNYASKVNVTIDKDKLLFTSSMDYYDPTINNYTESLISCYPMHNLSDAMGNYDLTQVATDSTTKYKKLGEGARYFNDEATEYAIADLGLNDYPYTICGWVMYNSSTAHTSLGITDYNGGDQYFTWGVTTGDRIRQIIDNGPTRSDLLYSMGWAVDTWYFTCGVGANSTSNKMYWNGVERIEVTTDISWNANFDTIGFGVWRMNQHDLLGYIDEVAYWDKALNQSEIDWLYNSGTGKTCEEIRQTGIGEVPTNNPPTISSFAPSNNTNYVDGTTSIRLNVTYSDADSDAGTVDFRNASDDTIICSNTSISAGTEVSCTWEGLTDGISNQWYVNVTDGTDYVTSGTYNFSINETQNNAPTISSFAPSNNTNYADGTTSIRLNVTYSDADSDAGTVDFRNASDDTIICSNTSISAGTEVSCTWEGLIDNTSNLWYVNITDGTDYVTSGTYNFSINATCTESWSCGAWSDSSNSCGTRTCTDANSCGTTVSKPSTSATCPSSGGTGGSGSTGDPFEPNAPKPTVTEENQTKVTVKTKLDKFSYKVNEPVIATLESFLNVYNAEKKINELYPSRLPKVQVEIMGINMITSYGIYEMKLNGINTYEYTLEDTLKEGKYVVRYIIDTESETLLEKEEFIVTQNPLLTSIIRQPIGDGDMKPYYIGGVIILFVLITMIIFSINKSSGRTRE